MNLNTLIAAVTTKATIEPDTNGVLDLIGAILPFVILVLVFWFLIIKPQKKQKQKHEAVISSLKIGDKLITVGGIVGVIQEMDEDTVTLKTGNSTMVVGRDYIGRIIPNQED